MKLILKQKVVIFGYSLLFSIFVKCLTNGALAQAIPEQQHKKRIKIGISAPLTGPAATYGMDVLTSLQFAVSKLGKDDFELFIEDDKCDSREAVAIAQRFIQVHHIDAVIGPVCSGPALATAPLYEKAKTVVMLTNASAEKLRYAGNYIYRTKPSDKEICNVLWPYILLHTKKLAIISEQTDFALGMKEQLLQNIKNKMKVTSEDFLPGTQDFRTILLKLKKTAADGLLILPQTESTLGLILRQLKELKWEVQIYGAHFPQSPTFLKTVGSEAEGIIFSATPLAVEITSPQNIELFNEYLAQYGPMRSIEFLFISTFEAVRALQQAFKSSSLSPNDYLNQTTFQGVAGSWHFDPDGEIVGIRYQVKKIIGHRVIVM